MERYYYHGVSEFIDTDALDSMLNIIDSGALKTRSSVGYVGDTYEHVCLYRKDEGYDYSGTAVLSTALGGWIEHCFCFIVSPYIRAQKTNYFHSTEEEESGAFTDLTDEWRSDGDIPLDRVVGVGIPFDSIEELRLSSDVVDREFDDKLSEVMLFAESMDWIVANSDEANFTDKLDEKLNRKDGMFTL